MKNEPKSKTKIFIGNSLAVLVFIGVFLLVKHFKQEWHNEKSMTEASISVSNKIDKKIQNAQSQSTSEKSATEILMEESHKYVKGTLDNSSTRKEKLVAASNMFFGAYFLNTRMRPEYCSNLGVDISSFVNEYKKTHHEILIVAEKLQIMDFKEHNRTYNQDNLYNLIALASNKMIKQEMKDAANYLKMTETELCQSFKQSSVEWNSEIDLRKRAPELTQLLLNTN